MKKTYSVANLCVGLAIAAIGGSAQAATIYACESNSQGTIRIVTAGAVCHARETLIFWNTAGAQGPQGVQGPAGPQGSQGPAGGATAFAGELIVHQGPADGVTTFNSVANAYAAASANGWTLIRVLPGVYVETAELPLNKDVVLQGAGTAASVLQVKANGGDYTNAIGHHTVFKDLTITDIFTYGGVELDNVTVAAGSAYASYGGLVVNHSNIFGNAQAQSQMIVKDSVVNGFVGIYDAFSGSRVEDTVIVGAGTGAAISILNGSLPGTVPTTPIVIENVTASGVTTGLLLQQGANARIKNSKIEATGDGVMISGSALTALATVNIEHSEVSAGTAAVTSVYPTANAITLVGSKLVGAPVQGNAGVTKIVNCYDGSYTAIPNQ